MSEIDLPIRVAALYRFVPVPDPATLRASLLAAAEANAIKGTLLVAREGFNGTIAGTETGIAAMIEAIADLTGGPFDVKYSAAAAMPFKRLKVRLKREIVTMGQPQVDPLTGTGHYVEPQDWNALIADPDTVVIDTRNDYEVAIGTFAGAVDPETRSFREFPDWWRENGPHLLSGKRKVAMFCTGGIRCEKSTAFLKAEGIEDVYHLKGGILKYLEEVPARESLWQGQCFVFDERVSVGHGLVPGGLTSCKGCGRALDETDRAQAGFVAGESCAACATRA